MDNLYQNHSEGSKIISAKMVNIITYTTEFISALWQCINVALVAQVLRIVSRFFDMNFRFRIESVRDSLSRSPTNNRIWNSCECKILKTWNVFCFCHSEILKLPTSPLLNVEIKWNKIIQILSKAFYSRCKSLCWRTHRQKLTLHVQISDRNLCEIN